MSIPFLPPDDYQFPSPYLALTHHDGLVAVSQDLDVPRLLNAYQKGIFPWFSEQGLFYWFCTEPRAVLHPAKLHIGKSLGKTLRNKAYRVTVNQAFSQVIAACARVSRPEQEGSWIAPEFEHAYNQLHRLHYAHSFECWYPTGEGWQLAGGLYGVQLGQIFYGESMFAQQADASKIAFAHAVPYLQRCGIVLIDCQQDTAHLARFGSELMAFRDFEHILQQHHALPLRQEIDSQTLLFENLP